MDILKPISIILFCLLIFGCEKKYNKTNKELIVFKEFNSKSISKTIKLDVYKKNSNYQVLEKENVPYLVGSSLDDLNLFFEELPMNKDYIIILDNKRYRISDVYYSIDTMRAGSNSWRIITHIDSFKVNGKMYRTDFIIPKEARIE